MQPPSHCPIYFLEVIYIYSVNGSYSVVLKICMFQCNLFCRKISLCLQQPVVERVLVTPHVSSLFTEDGRFDQRATVGQLCRVQLVTSQAGQMSYLGLTIVSLRPERKESHLDHHIVQKHECYCCHRKQSSYYLYLLWFHFNFESCSL